MEINQLMSQINGYFADAKTMYWVSFSILTLIGVGLLSAGARYFKRILFVVGAVPTYIIVHSIAQKMGWSDGLAIGAALFMGVLMILCSWLYIYTWGFWTTIGIASTIVLPFLDLKSLPTSSIASLGWMFMVLGVAGGSFALIKCRHIIVVVTALTGAGFLVFGANVMLASGNPQLYTGMSPSAFLTMFALEYVVAAAVGIFVQYKFTLPTNTVAIQTADGEVVSVKKKSKVAYVLLALILGHIGVHSLYAGQYRKGALQVIIGAAAGFLFFVPLLITWIWAICSITRASKNLYGNNE